MKYDDAPANATYEEQDRGTPAEFIFWTASRVGWVGAGASPTGWILVLVLIIMITFAMPFVRRNGYFQVFAKNITLKYTDLALFSSVSIAILYHTLASLRVLHRPIFSCNKLVEMVYWTFCISSD